MISPDTIVERVHDMPALSSALPHLLALRSDPTSTAEDYQRVIRVDPALTANLLRLANSPSYGSRGQIGTIRHAVSFLGQRRLFEAAISALFQAVIPDQVPGYHFHAEQFWRHSVAVAVLSEQLAEELELPSPDLLFTAGLLHDIGKLALGALMEDEAGDRVTLSADMCRAEESLMRTDHAEVGGLLARRWDLPEPIVVACRYHHAPRDPAAERHSQLVYLVHLADSIAHTLGFTPHGSLGLLVDPEVVEVLGLTSASLDIVAALSLERIEELGNTM